MTFHVDCHRFGIGRSSIWYRYGLNRMLILHYTFAEGLFSVLLLFQRWTWTTSVLIFNASYLISTVMLYKNVRSCYAVGIGSSINSALDNYFTRFSLQHPYCVWLPLFIPSQQSPSSPSHSGLHLSSDWDSAPLSTSKSCTSSTA